MRTFEVAEVEDAIDRPFASWASQCHMVSLAMVQSDLFEPGEARVARGSCKGVGGQHSWVVVGWDVYAPAAVIVDPTLWSYDPSVKEIWHGRADLGRHRPHGSGSIWEWGCPEAGGGPVVELTPSTPLSDAARDFLAMTGPLDRRGWAILSGAPVQGWPAREIITAMLETEKVAALVPVDIVGMLTDQNPGNLYFKHPAGMPV